MKIVMFDDHALFAKSLELLLLNSPFQLKHYTDTDNVLEVIKSQKPDIVLMDIHLGSVNGLEIGETVLNQFKDLKLVFLSGYDLPEYCDQAIAIGAKGFINKNVNPDYFIECLEMVAQGNEVFPRIDKSNYSELSQREKEVLQLLASGCSQTELSETLGISRRTVANHIQAIMSKLDVSSSISAIVKGIELGIVKLDNNR